MLNARFANVHWVKSNDGLLSMSLVIGFSPTLIKTSGNHCPSITIAAGISLMQVGAFNITMELAKAGTNLIFESNKFQVLRTFASSPKGKQCPSFNIPYQRQLPPLQEVL